MFIVAEMPLADLRSFTPRARSRLDVPDWTKDDLGNVFMRGFGRVALRNLSGLGLVGERIVADFDQAARFRSALVYMQPGWEQSIPIKPWFRRFYFDGVCAGRFEFGFLVQDDDEAVVFKEGVTSSYDSREIAGQIEGIPLLVRGPDLPEQEVLLAEACEPLGMAYLGATTRRAVLRELPLAETFAREVAVGPLSVHLRIANGRPIRSSRDCRQIASGPGMGLFVTTAKGSARRNGVVVQLSNSPSLEEGAGERAARVLFSHLNALIFSLDRALVLEKSGEASFRRAALLQAIKDGIRRLRNFAPTGPMSDTDGDFSVAVQTFAMAYEGRIDQLVGRLQGLADELSKPRTVRRVIAYLQSLVELAITTGAKAAAETAMKEPGQ